jgi:thiamine biosynthesis lipoprotein
MGSPTAVPADVSRADGLSIDGLWHTTFRSMASPVRVQLGPDAPQPAQRHAQVRSVFAQVDAECTRFDANSDLMRANAAGDAWCQVGDMCFSALKAAHAAHRQTDGLFDPRVLRTLVALGYDRTLPFGEAVDVGERTSPAGPVAGRWQPQFDDGQRRVRVGPEPIDLGGIGKGLALRLAARELADAGCGTYLIDAGGDCVCAGAGPDGSGWRIGVEDPAGGAAPVAVLELPEGACATSSVRLLSWRAGSRTVHHLIDPRTGQPAQTPVRSVTVHGPDPASAEVWSKVLFLRGDSIGAVAQERGIAALWVYDDASIGMSAAMSPFVIWRRR